MLYIVIVSLTRCNMLYCLKCHTSMSLIIYENVSMTVYDTCLMAIIGLSFVVPLASSNFNHRRGIFSPQYGSSWATFKIRAWSFFIYKWKQELFDQDVGFITHNTYHNGTMNIKKKTIMNWKVPKVLYCWAHLSSLFCVCDVSVDTLSVHV